MRALIFDFDGLMVDTESPAFDAWSAIYQEHGAKLELDEWVACVGSSSAAFDPVTRLQELTGKSLDRDALMADKERRKKHICDKLPVQPGVADLIDQANSLEWKIGVASSSSIRWVGAHLDRLNLIHHFPVVVTRDLVDRIKPFPDLFLKCAELLEVPPHECVVCEDSLNGIKAAKTAGMTALAIPGPITAGLDFSEADRRYDSLVDVRLADFLH